MLKISIIIPCFNEENNLRRGVLDQLDAFLSLQKFTYEVVIANDGATDNSASVISQYSKKYPYIRLVNLPHGGKPSAIWGGIKASLYPHLLLTDMDQSTPINQINHLLPFIQNFDIVIGSRGSARDGNTLLRQIGSKVFLSARRLIMLPNIIDTQCGFKAIKTSVAKKIFPQLQFFKQSQETVGWKVSAYDVELLFLAQKMGYKIKEVPVEWRNQDTSTTKGDFNARYRKESWQMIQEIWRVKSNDLKGIYDQK